MKSARLLRRLSLLSAFAAFAMPAKARFVYLRCTFPGAGHTARHIRYDEARGLAQVRRDALERIRSYEMEARKGFIAFGGDDVHWSIDRSTLRANISSFWGGEGHFGSARCVRRPASAYAAAGSVWTPQKARPWSRLDGLFWADEYRRLAPASRYWHSVRYTLDIGTDGRAVGCSTSVNIADSTLDHTLCEILTRRAKFWPATDAAGEPVVDTFSGTVVLQPPAE